MVNSLRQPGDRQSIVINFRKKPTVFKSGPNIKKTEGTGKKKRQSKEDRYWSQLCAGVLVHAQGFLGPRS